MAININPPDWLIQEYMNRQNQTPNILDSINKGFQNYANYKVDQRRERELADESKRRDQEMAMKGEENFYKYGSLRGLAPEIQQGITNPAQGPSQFIPGRDVASTAMGQVRMRQTANYDPASGSVIPNPTEDRMIAPQKSPIIEHYENYYKKYPNGSVGAELQNKMDANANSIDEMTAQQVREGKISLADAYKMKASGSQSGGSVQWKWDPIGGNFVPLPTKPGSMGSGVPTPTQTPRTGQGDYKSVAKEKANYEGMKALNDSVIAEIDRVSGLNKNSRGGVLGAALQKGQSALNVKTDQPEFTNTADVINTLKNQVARVLKSTFGGQLSDDERKYLNEVYGAAERMTPSERSIAMTNVKAMLRGKESESRAKYESISGGSPVQPTAQSGASQTGPHGNTVTQNGVTYTWNPGTGQYE